ncbi:MAG: penicillin-binding transpeptidase domain-containing protein [Alkalibacterium sp.]|nr:penicillin-binding transpeptidase domain-containing protein [Alkalibacterium sp.]
MNSNKRVTTNGKSKRGIVIGISVFLLIALAIGGWFFYSNWREEQRAIQRQEEVEATVEEYLSAKTEGDFDSFVSYLSPQSVADFDYSESDLAERYTTVYQGIGANNLSVQEHSVQLDEETDVYSVQYSMNMDTVLGSLSGLSYEAIIEETEEGTTIQWDPSLILPDMEEGDSVRLSFTEPDRGSIYDRHGNMLAGEGDAFQAGLYPVMVGEGEERDQNLSLISDTFDVSVERLKTLLEQSWVTEESLVPFAIVDEGETPEVTGVRYQRTSDRLYPLDEAAAHLVGYIGEVTAEDIERDPSLASGQIVGKAGLESVFDSQLRGHTGGQITIVDANDEVKSVVVENEKENGQSIRLTIDSDVQELLYNTFEDEPGSGAIMHPVTGEIIALVSAPSYSPQAFARGISSEDYSAYMDDEHTPFVNRYTGRYAPGSTFKILSSLVLLEEGEVTPEETNQIEGLQWSPGTDAFGDHQITRVNDSVSEVDLATAMIYSDNIYFAMEALDMGQEAFSEALDRLPFGESFELPFDMQPAQYANENTIDRDTLLADTAYGQGQVLMNSIHQLVFYSPAVNEGQLTLPTLLLEEGRGSSDQLFSSESANRVRDYLIRTVTDANGTANDLNGLSYSVGAKTGTAEIAGEEGNDTNGFLYVFDADDLTYSFVGFLEGQRSGDVVDRFNSFFEELKPLVSDYSAGE